MARTGSVGASDDADLGQVTNEPAVFHGVRIGQEGPRVERRRRSLRLEKPGASRRGSGPEEGGARTPRELSRPVRRRSEPTGLSMLHIQAVLCGALIPRIRPGSGAVRDGGGSVAGGSGGGRTAFCFSGPHDTADDGGKECEENSLHGVFLFYGFGGKTAGRFAWICGPDRLRP